MDLVKLDRGEIEKAIEEGNNLYGGRHLAVRPNGDVSVHWADTNRPWDPWADDAQVIGLPALYPAGDGLEAEAATDCLREKLSPEKFLEVEFYLEKEDVRVVDYAEEYFPDWMEASRDNQVAFLAEAFLAACNGDGSDLNDPAPWGMTSEFGEVVEPPFEFEWAADSIPNEWLVPLMQTEGTAVLRPSATSGMIPEGEHKRRPLHPLDPEKMPISFGGRDPVEMKVYEFEGLSGYFLKVDLARGNKIKAQALYDLREEFEFCSGNELHEFFRGSTSDGEPSPSGEVGINQSIASVFVLECCQSIEENSPSIFMDSCRQALFAQVFEKSG